MKKTIQNIIIIICICSFGFFTYNIYKYKKAEKEQKELNDKLINMAVKNIEQTNDLDENTNQLPISVDFEILKTQNQDIIGWLYCEESNINYPIAKFSDNSYYLSRAIDGSYNPSGTLFIDYRNDENFLDNNTYIYGHNMKNKTMFGNLEKYKEQDYYNNHKIMYLFTKERNYMIEIFSAFTTEGESEIYDFIKNESNDRLIELAKEKSNFVTDVNVTNEDKTIILSTCAYDYKNARYVVIGALKEII